MEFYSKAQKYWKDIPPTVDGMLGGYGHISSIDIDSSKKFLLKFLRVSNLDLMGEGYAGGGGEVSDRPQVLTASSCCVAFPCHRPP